jgi:hypothetical protein
LCHIEGEAPWERIVGQFDEPANTRDTPQRTFERERSEQTGKAREAALKKASPKSRDQMRDARIDEQKRLVEGRHIKATPFAWIDPENIPPQKLAL